MLRTVAAFSKQKITDLFYDSYAFHLCYFISLFATDAKEDNQPREFPHQNRQTHKTENKCSSL